MDPLGSLSFNLVRKSYSIILSLLKKYAFEVNFLLFKNASHLLTNRSG